MYLHGFEKRIGQLHQLIHLSECKNSLKICQSQSAHQQHSGHAVCYAQWYTQVAKSDIGQNYIYLIYRG